MEVVESIVDSASGPVVGSEVGSSSLADRTAGSNAIAASGKPKFEDGFLILPEGPGLGIDIDPDKLEKYRVSL